MIDTSLNTLQIEDQHTSGAYPKRPLTVVRGAGCTVWDETDTAYLDMTSGQGVALVGHAHPAVVAAIQQQAQTLITCPEIFYNDQRSRLYGLLSEVLPDGLDRYFLCNSGAEAVEGALKLARLLTERTGIVAVKRGFHGRTLGALALTWSKQYREPFAAWQADVTHITLDNYDELDAITEETAAVMVEAVQGEGGVHPADHAYLQALRERCDATGALLIVDEIQTGFGRTGQWFAFQHAGITPDIVTLGKGIAGGVPMGAVVWHGELGTMPRSSHGSTFGGNPLASAAAVATISTIRDEQLPQRAAELGAWFMEELHNLDLAQVREIRGCGLMIGLQLRGRVTPVLRTLQMEHQILALPAGSTVLRLLPPLVISRDELLRVRDVLAEVLA